MNNLIKAEWFRYMKTSKITTILLVVLALFLTLFTVTTEDGTHTPLSSAALSKGGIAGILCVLSIVVLSITSGYTNRTQLYEVMAGYSPSCIIFSRVAVYVPFITAVYLMPTLIIYLLCNHSTEMIQTLVLFTVIYLRVVLTGIFLTPLLKESSFASIFLNIMFIMPRGIFNTAQAYSDSIFGFTGFGQLTLLSNGITAEFSMKIIITSIVSCIICYFIGYLTLKKKVDLEPHPLA